MEQNQTVRQEIAKIEKEIDDLYSVLQRDRLKIDEERDRLMSKKKAFSEMLQEEYGMALAILQNNEQDISVELQAVNGYLEHYDVIAEEACKEELRRLDRKDEQVLENFSRKRRILESEMENNYCRLRETE